MYRVGMHRGLALSAIVVCSMLGIASRSASAATRIDVGVGFGGGGYGPVYPAPVYVAPVYRAPVCEGHYETHIERVLVAPERRDRRWADAVYETRYYNGYAQTVCVSQPGWREFYVPAQYENRSVQVWVPGCTTYYAPRYVAPAPSFGLGLNFRGRL